MFLQNTTAVINIKISIQLDAHANIGGHILCVIYYPYVMSIM